MPIGTLNKQASPGEPHSKCGGIYHSYISTTKFLFCFIVDLLQLINVLSTIFQFEGNPKIMHIITSISKITENYIVELKKCIPRYISETKSSKFSKLL
jgi:hypothetical protein